MAQYFTDFSGNTPGQPVPGWTQRWRNELTLTALADAQAQGGMVARLTKSTEAGSRCALSLNAVAPAATVEVYARFRSVGASVGDLLALTRGAGTASSETSGRGGYYHPSGVIANRYNTGSISTAVQTAYTVTTGVWYNLVFTHVGNAITAKVWAVGTDEANAVSATTNQSLPSAAGWVGLTMWFGGANFAMEIDVLGVGTDGDPAPRSGLGAPPVGVPVVTNVAPDTESAVVTYNYAESDATGFEYRLNGGAAAVLGASPATISGLTPGTPYQLQVRAINANGAGAWTTVTEFSTLPLALPPQGTVTITGVTPGVESATVVYTYSAADQTGFEFRFVDIGLAMPIGASPALISDLGADTEYSIQVRAVNAQGASAWSTAATFTTLQPPLQPPAGVVTITNVSPSYNSAMVTYSYSLLDATSYEYRLDGGPPSVLGLSPASIGGLTPNTAYALQTRAANGAGVSAWSAVTNFETGDPPPVAKAARLSLFDEAGQNLLSNLTGIHALWWDQALVTQFSAPFVVSGLGTNELGQITVNITGVATEIGQPGWLLLYRPDAVDPQDSLVFFGQVAVESL